MFIWFKVLLKNTNISYTNLLWMKWEEPSRKFGNTNQEICVRNTHYYYFKCLIFV